MLHILNNKYNYVMSLGYHPRVARKAITNLSSVPFIIMLYKTIHVIMNLLRMDYNKTDFVLAFVGTEGFRS